MLFRSEKDIKTEKVLVIKPKKVLLSLDEEVYFRIKAFSVENKKNVSEFINQFLKCYVNFKDDKKV